jgi:uncharacterized protein YjbI with pentapeptide repeats
VPDPNNLALVIGIDLYQDDALENLLSCKKDANDICSLLSDQDYTIFGDRPIIGSNLDKKFGWVEVRENIGNFFKKARPSQKLLFYFSGHGIVSGNDVYLGTPQVDHNDPWTHGFSLTDLTKQMDRSKSTQIVAIIDACYSGATELPNSMKRKAAAKDNADRALATYDKVWKNTSKSKAIYLLLSSQSYEPSNALEGSNSLYTRSLLDGLQGIEPKIADKNGNVIDFSGSIEDNGEVTPNSLHNYVYHQVANITDQVPVLKSIASSRFAIVNYPELAKRSQTSQKDYLLQLLRDGKIVEFNKIRRKDNYSRLDLYNAELVARDLSYADLRKSDLNLANLSRAKLRHTKFKDASLKGVDLSQANLSGADLSLANLKDADAVLANLSNARLSEADLSEVYLRKANLSGADLHYANLSRADLLGGDLSEANLKEVDLAGTNVSEANLSGADLSGASALDSNFSSSYLSRADLTRAHLLRANLSNADLTRADLSEADLTETDLSNADLTSAKLVGTKLLETDLSNADLTSANLSSSIILGLTAEHYPTECKNANFNDAIIDDEKLTRHLHNSNGNNVPHAVKDRKELRKKFEERGFTREKIDYWLMLHTSLPYS